MDPMEEAMGFDEMNDEKMSDKKLSDKKISFEAGGKAVTLYKAEKSGAPLVVFNNFEGDGSGVVSEMQKIGCADCNLLSVGGLNWDHDMTPWYCPPLTKGDTPCTGGADDYLKVLLDVILPEALARIDGEPEFFGLAGYSLAGLFAIYDMYQTDRFSRICSMSGSLWFPDFREYATSHSLVRKPDRLYLSLGDREARTRVKMLKPVQENTEYLADYYRERGIETEYELNPGNHFQEAELRSAKGITAILQV